MDGYAANPDLMKYLQGEISFETWLEQQAHRNNSHEHQATNTQQFTTAGGNTIPNTTTPQMTSTMPTSATDDPGSVFSSWGDAFTSSSGAGIGSNQDQLQPPSQFSGHNFSLQSQITSSAATDPANMGGEDEESDFEEEDEDGESTNTEEILQLGESLLLLLVR